MDWFAIPVMQRKNNVRSQSLSFADQEKEKKKSSVQFFAPSRLKKLMMSIEMSIYCCHHKLILRQKAKSLLTMLWNSKRNRLKGTSFGTYSRFWYILNVIQSIKKKVWNLHLKSMLPHLFSNTLPITKSATDRHRGKRIVVKRDVATDH